MGCRVIVRCRPSGANVKHAAAARAVKAESPDLGVLLLSQHVETGPTADLLGLPAFGYLLKDRVLDVGDFIDACERISRGGSALDPNVVEALLASRQAAPLGHLSQREREVLALMAEGLRNSAIAERLSLSARTVEAHVAHLRTKLDIPDSQQSNRRILAGLRGHTDRIETTARTYDSSRQGSTRHHAGQPGWTSQPVTNLPH